MCICFADQFAIINAGGGAGSTSVKSNNDIARTDSQILSDQALIEPIFTDPLYSQLAESGNQQTPDAESLNDNTLEDGSSQVVNSTGSRSGDGLESRSLENSTLKNKNITPEPQQKIISFAFNKSDVNAEYGELLWQYAQYLKENEGVILEVSGHTDNSGARVYNESLSKKRADQVANILFEFGAPVDRVVVIGKGSESPLANAVLNREHRRVELNYSNVEGVMVSSVN